MLLKIGELAKRSGLTIRALRHYHAIGLLTPSCRSDGGYRLYDRDDVAKLYRIQALRRLDLPLAEIAGMLAGGGPNLPQLIGQQIDALQRQISHASELHHQLLQLQQQLAAHHEPRMDDWLAALEGMVNAAKYFSAAELDALKARRARGAPEAGSEKAALIATLEQLRARGVAPQQQEARALAGRWIALLLDEVGGDEGMLMKLYTMHWNEPGLRTLSGVDRDGIDYISQAMAHSRLEIYAKYCDPHEIARLQTCYVGQTTAWPPLICAVREQLAGGAPADSPAMQALARQWRALSHAKAGGDTGLQIKLQNAFQNEPALRIGSGIDLPLITFIQQAMSQLTDASTQGESTHDSKTKYRAKHPARQ